MTIWIFIPNNKIHAFRNISSNNFASKSSTLKTSQTFSTLKGSGNTCQTFSTSSASLKMPKEKY